MADQVTQRRCIGSKRFGIEPHDAPVDDFPKQPSQRDGLGRMCATHWNLYTAGLARDAKARKAAGETPKPVAEPTSADPAIVARKRTRRAATPTADADGQDAAG